MEMNFIFVCSLLILCAKFTCGFRFADIYKVEEIPLKDGEDPGEPLILTPYLEDGRIDEARKLAIVPEEIFLGIKSYAGYFTVNGTHGSNSFFWFIPATDADYTEVPLLLWLQGGPGGPSIYATFLENGPFEMIDDTHIELSNISWTSTHSVLYIDNPVGTGFSFTNGRWCTNEEEIGEDLYTALIQFFKLFPELQKNDFFIAGESYAGKYVPAISYTIHKKNFDADLKINLKGLAIGDGFSDPVNQLNYGDYLFQNGLIDFNTRNIFKSYENKTVDLIHEKKFDEALHLFNEIFAFFENTTGFDYYYNYLYSEGSIDTRFSAFVQQCNIRKALHVGNTSFVTDDEVTTSLSADFMKSVAPWISELLSHYRVLTYNGQLDIIVAYPLTVNFLRQLNFSASEEYKTAKRYEWFVNGTIAGYAKEAGNLTEVLVRNAGHMVPHDQPEWALDLISKFVRNIPLH